MLHEGDSEPCSKRKYSRQGQSGLEGPSHGQAQGRSLNTAAMPRGQRQEFGVDSKSWALQEGLQKGVTFKRPGLQR